MFIKKSKSALHKKGLLTVALIILTESITLSNAVQFWSTYQTWSNKYGNGRYNQNRNQNQNNQDKIPHGAFADFSKRTSPPPSSQNPVSCSSDTTTSTSTSTSTSNNNLSARLVTSTSHSTSNSPLPSRLHPRRLAQQLASATKKNSQKCSKAMYNCCNISCPSCMTLGDGVDVVGGIEQVHESHTHGNNHYDSSHYQEQGETYAHQFLDIRGGSSATHSTASIIDAIPLPTPYGLPLNMWKVIFQIFLTALNVVCWLGPLKSKKMTENKLGLSLANAFSGGVFLSLAFGHLIPECIHGFEGMNEALPFMLVLGGYLLIFFVEKVAFDAHGLMNVEEEKGSGDVAKKEGDEAAAPEPFNGRSAVILLGALAVHSVLEMTALGLADSFGDSALLSLSIALHQPAESIALLVAFLKSGMPKDQIIKFLSVFSACGPIGVAIGMAVNEFASPIVDSIMLAIVAGTFVYVGATEVIPEEWEEQEHKWKKFFALMSGIGSIFAITQYTMTLEGHSQ